MSSEQSTQRLPQPGFDRSTILRETALNMTFKDNVHSGVKPDERVRHAQIYLEFMENSVGVGHLVSTVDNGVKFKPDGVILTTDKDTPSHAVAPIWRPETAPKDAQESMAACLLGEHKHVTFADALGMLRTTPVYCEFYALAVRALDHVAYLRHAGMLK